jgi:hypothetical protein
VPVEANLWAIRGCLQSMLFTSPAFPPGAMRRAVMLCRHEIVRELANTDYGSREYSARDFEGHLWSFGSYDPWK